MQNRIQATRLSTREMSHTVASRSIFALKIFAVLAILTLPYPIKSHSRNSSSTGNYQRFRSGARKLLGLDFFSCHSSSICLATRANNMDASPEGLRLLAGSRTASCQPRPCVYRIALSRGYGVKRLLFFLAPALALFPKTQDWCSSPSLA